MTENKLLDKSWKLLLFMVLATYALIEARAFLMPLVFSAFLALVLSPVVSFLEQKKMNSALAIISTMIMLTLFLFLILYFVSVQSRSLILDLPDLLDRFNRYLGKIEEQFYQIAGQSSAEQLNLLKENSSSLISSGTSFISNAVNTTSSLLTFFTLIPIYVVFMLLSRENFSQFIDKLGEKNGKDYHALAKEIKAMVYSYIGGLLIVVSIVSLLNTVGLLALGIEHALFLGILSGALTVIPYIGIIVGGAFPVIVALLTKDSLFYPIAVIILIGLVQFLEGNFITPKIVGSKVNINPLAAIIALLVGASIWGIMGMILAIPSVGIIRILMSNLEGLEPYAQLLGNSEKKEVMQEEAIEDETTEN